MEVGKLLSQQSIDLQQTDPEASAQKMRQAIELVASYAPEYTEYGQAISQLAKWSKTEPAVIASYAQRKLSQRDPSAKLTEEQASALVKEAQDAGAKESKLDELRKKVRSLQAKLRRLQDERPRKTRKASGRRPAFVRAAAIEELAANEAALMADIRAALGMGGPLKMARAEGEAKGQAQPPPLSDDVLANLARLGALRLLRAERGTLTVEDFKRQLVSEFGPQIRPHVDRIHRDAVRVVRETMRSKKRERGLERIAAREGNEDLSREELEQIAAEEARARKALLKVWAEHERVAKAESPTALQTAIANAGEEEQLTAAALLFTEQGMDRGEAGRRLRRAFDLEAKAADELAVRGFKLYRDTRKGMDEERARLKGETTETADEMRKARSEAATAKRSLLRKLSEIERGPESNLKRLNNLYRGIVVSAMQTAVRNIESQAVRSGVEGVTDAAEAAMNKALRRAGIPVAEDALPEGVGVVDALGPFTFLVQRNKRRAEGILDDFPEEYEQLFGSLSASYDLSQSSGTGKAIDRVLTKAEKAVEVLNFMNKWQEFATRRAVFLGTLNARMRAKGVDIFDLSEEGRAAEIPKADIQQAVRKALEVTFATTPKRGTVAGDFVHYTSSAPAPVNPLTFSRFMYNSAKFVFEYQPTTALRGLYRTAKNRQVETRDFAKAAIGSVMLLTAAQILKAFGGDDDEWHTLELPGVGVIDARPYQPFSAYLFIAHSAGRLAEGRKLVKRWGDLGEGLFGLSQFENPAWEALKAFGAGDEDRSAEMAKKQAGNTVGAIFTPLKTAKDLIAAFDKEERIVRDYSDEPFMGGIKRNVPFASRGSKARVDQATGEPLEQPKPALKPLAGLRVMRPDDLRPKQSKAEELANEIRSQMFSDDKPRTKEEKEASRAVARLKEVGRKNPEALKRLPDLVRRNVITAKQAEGVRDAVSLTPLQEDVKALPLADAERVYEAATPEERISLEGIMRAKRLNKAAAEDKAERDAENPARAERNRRRAEKANRTKQRRREARYGDEADRMMEGAP